MQNNAEERTVTSGLRTSGVHVDRTPAFRRTVFQCPRLECRAVAAQVWVDVYQRTAFTSQGGGRSHNVDTKIDDLALASCSACKGRSLWFEQQLVYPKAERAEVVPTDLPNEMKKDFEEAAGVAPISPRAAAALLRMIVEELCKKQSGKTKFEDAIAELERRGLPPQIGTAMDVVRWNGNEALHAGRLYGNDDAATVALLFRLVTTIVAWAITDRRELQELYEKIPPDKRKAAEERRAKNAPKADG